MYRLFLIMVLSCVGLNVLKVMDIPYVEDWDKK